MVLAFGTGPYQGGGRWSCGGVLLFWRLPSWCRDGRYVLSCQCRVFIYCWLWVLQSGISDVFQNPSGYVVAYLANVHLATGARDHVNYIFLSLRLSVLSGPEAGCQFVNFFICYLTTLLALWLYSIGRWDNWWLGSDSKAVMVCCPNIWLEGMMKTAEILVRIVGVLSKIWIKHLPLFY
jgi:hypothetical protein